MNDVEIIKVIEKYLKKSIYSYAVLIDGEWGSGKTYFVKNILMPHINKLDYTTIEGKTIKLETLYISLYGISTIEEITNQILARIIPKKNENKVFNKISNLGAKLVSDYIKSKDISTSGFVEGIIDFIDFEKYVLIFDDLERCGLNVNEVLGYINNFVEHDGIKTIIIANQNEMGKINATNNLELKYLLALNENIQIKDSNEENESKENKINDSKENKIDLEELKERSEIIFRENYLYQQIKEKIIGVTISYKADIKNIIENIINNIIQNKILCQIAINNKEFIIKISSDLKHENLRTIQFALEKFSELGDIIEKLDCRNFKEQILTEVFCYTILSAIKFKKEDFIYDWQGFNEFGNIFISNKNSLGSIKGFKFIDNAITQSYLNIADISVVINKYVLLLESEQKRDNPLVKLERYWELEDKEIIEQLTDIEIKLISNKIKISLYSQIIVMLIKIKNMGFHMINMEDLVEYMKKNIESESLDISYLRFDEFSVALREEDNIKDYNKYSKLLNEKLREKRFEVYKENLNSYFIDANSDNWGGEFYTYCWNNRGLIRGFNAFFSIIKIDDLAECLKKSHIMNINNFRNAVIEVYSDLDSNVNFGDDYSNMLKLINELSDKIEEVEGISRKYNLKLLIDTLQRQKSKEKEKI